MKDAKRLESDLYNDSEESRISKTKTLAKSKKHKNSARGVLGTIVNYLLGSPSKLSTHAGYYFGGMGWRIGLIGGFAKEVISSIYFDGPQIASDILRFAWQEALYHTVSSAIKTGLNSLYWSGVVGGAFYVGGSVAAGNFSGFVRSFLGLRED